MDGKCLSLTASYIRLKHKEDKSVPVCSFYEVQLSTVSLKCCTIKVFHDRDVTVCPSLTV